MSVQIAHDGGYRVYRTPDGRTRRYVGPVWATPKEAARYADALQAAEGISPLRERLSESSVPLEGQSSRVPTGAHGSAPVVPPRATARTTLFDL